MQKIRYPSLAGKSLFLIWVILCLSLFIYFPGIISYVHGITNLDSLQVFLLRLQAIQPLYYLGELLRSLAGVLIFSTICLALGARFLEVLDDKAELPATQLAWLALAATAFLIGQVVLALVFIFLGLFHQLTPLWSILVMLLAAAVGLRPLIRLLSLLPRGNPFILKPERWTDRIILSLSIGVIFLSLMYSSSRISYDAASFYFSDEKVTALTNHLLFFQHNSFVISSFQTGIEYAPLIQVFGDQSARMYAWISGLMIIIFGLAIGERAGLSLRARLILLVSVITSTAFIDLMGDGKIDLTSSAFAIGAVFWTIESLSRKAGKKTLLLTGIIAGSAAASRPYNALLLFVFIVIFYFLRVLIDKDLSRDALIKTAFWMGIGVIGPAICHIILNWAILGEPLADLSNSIQYSDSSNWQWAIDPKYIWLIRALYPLVATFINTRQSLGNITPLFLALLPAVFWVGIRKTLTTSRVLVELLAAAIATLILWIGLFYTVFELRYVLFLWILVMMPLAFFIDHLLNKHDVFLKIVTNFAMIAVLIFIGLRVIYISIDTYSPVNPQGIAHCSAFTLCDYFEPVNELAAKGDRVLAMNGFRYYLRPDLLACASKDQEYLVLQKLSDNDQTAFWTEAYREGYKYVIYEEIYSSQHLHLGFVPAPSRTPPWLMLVPMSGSSTDPQISYQMIVTNPPVEVDKHCQYTRAGTWEVESISSTK